MEPLHASNLNVGYLMVDELNARTAGTLHSLRTRRQLAKLLDALRHDPLHHNPPPAEWVAKLRDKGTLDKFLADSRLAAERRLKLVEWALVARDEGQLPITRGTWRGLPMPLELKERLVPDKTLRRLARRLMAKVAPKGPIGLARARGYGVFEHDDLPCTVVSWYDRVPRIKVPGGVSLEKRTSGICWAIAYLELKRKGFVFTRPDDLAFGKFIEQQLVEHIPSGGCPPSWIAQDVRRGNAERGLEERGGAMTRGEALAAGKQEICRPRSPQLRRLAVVYSDSVLEAELHPSPLAEKRERRLRALLARSLGGGV